jgi:predicted Zn-dependent peptidase
MRGLANMTALLMREGTTKHTSREISEALDTIGATFGANSGVSSFTSNITAEDVQRVAQKYIDINHLQIVAVGDAAKTRDVLAKFGSVQEYDADGKPVRTGSAGGSTSRNDLLRRRCRERGHPCPH